MRPGRLALIADPVVHQPTFMRTTLGAARTLLFRRIDPPDLGSQLEELLIEVWRLENYERKHPFTCGVIREAYRSIRVPRPQLN